MRILYLSIYLSIVFISGAQNLVPNYSFETYTICPTSASQIEVATPWNAATPNSSTDYFNNCSVGVSGVPYNAGFQYPRTGNAYGGFIVCHASNQREYIQVQLTSALVINKTYYIELYVNASNWSSACNNIAANLSTTRPYTSAFGALQPLTPHIMLIGNPVIQDTLNWVKISGCYTAQGGEQYLTIGNFFDNANTVVTGTTGIAYYYVDDVLVEEITGQCVTGVHEYKKDESINVYPNPTIGKLKVISQNIKDPEQLQIKITNVFGIEILNESYKEEIDLSLFEKGVYFVSLLQGSESLGVKKIIKE